MNLPNQHPSTNININSSNTKKSAPFNNSTIVKFVNDESQNVTDLDCSPISNSINDKENNNLSSNLGQSAGNASQNNRKFLP